MNIGANIRAIRQEKKISLRKLAEMAGLEAAHLSRIENNKIVPNTNTVEKIAAALNANIKDLYKVDEEVDSFTIKLVEQLLSEGIITDPENIPQDTLDLIISAFKNDIRRIKNQK